MHIHTGINVYNNIVSKCFVYIIIMICMVIAMATHIMFTYNNTIIQLRGSVSDHVYLKQLDVTCILPTPLVALMTNMGVVSCQLEHRSLEILLVASQIDVISLLHNAQISSALPQTA